MKKKFLGSAAAIGLAGLTLVPSFCIVASAQTYSEAIGKIKTNHRYASDVAYQDRDGIWYPNLDALADATGSTYSKARHDTPEGGVNSYSSSNRYFDTSTGYYIARDVAATLPISGYRVDGNKDSIYYIPSSLRYASNISYLGSNGVWYPNTEALYRATGSRVGEKSKTPEQEYNAKFHYFDPRYGYYTSTQATDCVIDVSSGTATPYDPYYSTVTRKYYPSRFEALARSNNDETKVIDVREYITGYYSKGVYYDPYQYYLLLNDDVDDASEDTAYSNAGVVTLDGKTGWSNVTSNIRTAADGTTLIVNMKKETTVPSSVMAALKNKNVNLQLKLNNGTIYTFNGKEVTSSKEINLKTEFNTNKVPSKLVKAVTNKFDAVSTAQMSVGSSSFGAKADVSVKFSTKRAGCTARLYRYNEEKNSLQLVATSSVEDSGRCLFKGVNKGGNFVVVLSK